jgi:hypothetical protein
MADLKKGLKAMGHFPPVPMAWCERQIKLKGWRFVKPSHHS